MPRGQMRQAQIGVDDISEVHQDMRAIAATELTRISVSASGAEHKSGPA